MRVLDILIFMIDMHKVTPNTKITIYKEKTSEILWEGVISEAIKHQCIYGRRVSLLVSYYEIYDHLYIRIKEELS